MRRVRNQKTWIKSPAGTPAPPRVWPRACLTFAPPLLTFAPPPPLRLLGDAPPSHASTCPFRPGGGSEHTLRVTPAALGMSDFELREASALCPGGESGSHQGPRLPPSRRHTFVEGKEDLNAPRVAETEQETQGPSAPLPSLRGRDLPLPFASWGSMSRCIPSPRSSLEVGSCRVRFRRPEAKMLGIHLSGPPCLWRTFKALYSLGWNLSAINGP